MGGVKKTNLETTFNLKKKIRDIFALTRWRDTFDFNFIIVTLSYIAAEVKADFTYPITIIASQLGVWFIFMINDVEDAEEDATDPKKLRRNVISHGAISKEEGTIYTFFVAILSLLLFGFLSYVKQSPLPIIVSFITLLTGFLYSYRRVRLKAIPVIDIISHAYMLAAGLFLSGYFVASGNSQMSFIAIILTVFTFVISMYGQLENEIRDILIDKREGIKTLATILGKKPSQVLQLLILLSGIGLGVYCLIHINPSRNWLIQSGLILLLTELLVVIIWNIRGRKYVLKDQLHRFLLVTSMVSLFLYNIGGFIK
jgi:4-hydroxybenzoate polyprenyltransferase